MRKFQKITSQPSYLLLLTDSRGPSSLTGPFLFRKWWAVAYVWRRETQMAGDNGVATHDGNVCARMHARTHAYRHGSYATELSQTRAFLLDSETGYHMRTKHEIRSTVIGGTFLRIESDDA